jgi:16S rRNA (uracil1498-N3)-methyltransferase
MRNKQYYFSREINNDRIILDNRESKHCTRVLRHSIGDRIEVLDGNGNVYRCILDRIENGKAVLAITEKSAPGRQRDFFLHMAIGPTKHPTRFEFFLEKVTEIGIDQITPVISKFSERDKIKTDRLEQIMISAMKQSGQYYLPVLNAPVTFDSFISGKLPGSKYIAHCLDPGIPVLSASIPASDTITLMIGPEGGYDPAEIQQAIRSGFHPVNLGKSRLRTETAGIVGVTTIHHLFLNRPLT